MRKCETWLIVILITWIGFLPSCGGGAGRGNGSEPVWSYSPQSIKIHYRATQDLNLYNDTPHTLILKIFQLKDISRFKALLHSRAGIIKVLQFVGQNLYLGDAQQDVLYYEQEIVSPGDEKTISLDRMKGVRWVAIVAGYYNLSPTTSFRCFKIPIVYEKKGIIFRKKIAKPGRLFVNLILGPTSIQSVGG